MRRVPRVALLLAVTACAACAPRDRPPPHLLYDLARRVPVAELDSEWDVLLMGTPAAEAWQEKGFRKETWDGATDTAAIAGSHAQVLLQWSEALPRRALLDMAPVDETVRPKVSVQLNGRPIGEFELRKGRHVYAVDLPAELQRPRPRSNRLRLRFGAEADAREDAPPIFPARLFTLTIGLAADPRLTDLAGEDAPPAPVSIATEANRPQITQAGTSGLRYALHLPEGGELRFTPRRHAVHRAARRDVGFEVRLEQAGSPARSLWQQRLTGATDPMAEVVVALPPAADPVALTLRVDATAGQSAWGVWIAPRILGRSGGDPLVAEVLVDPPGTRALREGIQGFNVVLVILDAAGAGHFGCYGHARHPTPEVDSIAKRGAVFENAYTPAVFTRSAMASVWTSQYPDQHHAQLDYGAPLPADRLTLAEVLTRAGVASAGFIGNPSAGRPFKLHRGFAEFEEVYRRAAGRLHRADDFREVLSRWLDARKGKERFFAYVHFREPHFPYDPPAPFLTLFGPDTPLPAAARREAEWIRSVNSGKLRPSAAELDHLGRLYDANLAFVDAEVGALRRALEAAGQWQRTVLIVAADHGEQLGEHGFIGHNEQVFQQSVRIPLIVRFPEGRGPAGVRVEGLVDLLDVAPTIADVFGVAPRDRSPFKGRSLLTLLAGGPGKAATVCRSTQEKPVYALIDRRFKFVYDVYTRDEKLYDFAADPGETVDLVERQPLRAAALRQSLQAWLLQLKADATTSSPAPISPEDLENLRALGYVQ